MLFLILLGDPIGHREYFTVSGVGECKADGGRSPVFALAVPRDAFPFEAGSLEALLLLGTFIDSNRLVLHEPFNILVDKRVQALLRRYLKIDRRHLVWRLASDALIGYLGFPGVGDIQRNRWVVLGDVQRFRRGKDGEQEGESENGNGKGDFLHNVLGAETEPVVSWSAVKFLRIQ
jgi:hypothetical protein